MIELDSYKDVRNECNAILDRDHTTQNVYPSGKRNIVPHRNQISSSLYQYKCMVLSYKKHVFDRSNNRKQK